MFESIPVAISAMMNTALATLTLSILPQYAQVTNVKAKRSNNDFSKSSVACLLYKVVYIYLRRLLPLLVVSFDVFCLTIADAWLSFPSCRSHEA